MTASAEDVGMLLKFIPTDQLKSQQKAKIRGNDTWSTYRLLREPKDVDELECYDLEKAIWRDNGTLTYIRQSSISMPPDLHASEKYLSFDLSSSISCIVVGKTDKSIAETVAYFWNLKYSQKYGPHLKIDSLNKFNFSAIEPNHLTQFFKRNSNGTTSFCGITLSVAQSVALATMADPIDLILRYPVHFEDAGRAFVNALESRRSSFGTLALRFYALMKTSSSVFFRFQQLKNY